jgi:ubiquinone biosynthesis monooxygenase Coq7
VIEHLESHLHALPQDDDRSRRIVEQMQADEARHGTEAREAGGRDLPRLIRELMRRTARVMTFTAYRL